MATNVPKASEVIVTRSIRPRRSRDPISLKTFVEEYSNKLPLAIQVHTGYFDDCNRLSLSAYERLTVHIVKRTEVVVAKSATGCYKIPIYSALEFTFAYNSTGAIEGASSNYIFKSVNDLLAANALPKAVKCTKKWNDNKCSVSDGDLLYILQANKNEEGDSIKVYNSKSAKVMTLPRECAGYFTTNPNQVHFYLSDIVKMPINPFPCLVSIFRKADGDDLLNDLHSHLTSAVLCLEEKTVEVALVASTLNDCGTGLIEIPVDIPEIKITVTKSSEIEVSSKHVSKNYHLKNVQTSLVNNPKDYDIQLLLYSKVRKGHKSDEHDYVEYPLPTLIHSPVQPVPDKPENRLKDTLHRVPYALDSLPAIQQQFEELKSSMADVKKKLEHFKAIEEEFKDIKMRLDMLVSTTETNRKFVSKMKTFEVLRLLDAMSLTQYAENVSKEQIDGTILLCLDDALLKNSLDVTEESHRIKILNVISGALSAKEILSQS